jgi:hypothetical protein
MRTELINEEIQRAKLLMGYNSKKTLTENEEVIEHFALNEGVGNAVVDDLLKTLVKTEGNVGLRSSVEAAIKDWGGIAVKNEKGLYYTSKNADEIIKAMEKGTISSVAEAGKLVKSMFKNSGSIEIKAAAGDAIVAMDSFAKKYGGLTREQMVERLMGRPGNYTRAEAETLAKKFENIKGGGKIKPDPVPVKPDPVPVKPDPVPWNPTIWERIKNLNWRKAVKYLIGAGLLYWLWKYLTSENAPFPECLRGKLSGDDAKKIQEMGLDNALILTNTGNGDIDSAGGGIFYDDNSFKSVNGRYSGKWSGDGPIKVDIGGKEYIIDCGGSPVPPPPPVPTKGKCKPCSSFPMSKWCKSDKIKDIQNCLGGLSVDGCYGPKTEAKLKEMGYSTTITQSEYDKITKECKNKNVDNGSSDFDTDVYTSTEI